MNAGTPIAEDLRERYERCCHPDDEAYSAWECTLIERVSAAEERERVLREAANEFRDAVLNQRGWFEEPCLDNDQTNSVLGAFDDTIGAALATPAPEQPAKKEQHDELQARKS